MKANVLKYIGSFSGSEAKGVVFPRGVPVLVGDTKLYESLVTQPDFAESNLQELEEYGAANPVAVQTEADGVMPAVPLVETEPEVAVVAVVEKKVNPEEDN